MESAGRPWTGSEATLVAVNNMYNMYNSISDIQPIPCGVPQGSVLGPLLFIIYTNDLPNCLSDSKAILFADDTTLYVSSNNIKTLYHSVNSELESLNDWFRSNKLSLNIGKHIMFYLNTTKCQYQKI